MSETKVINNTPPFKFERDEYGLLKHIQYKFTPEGFVDWRALIPTEYLYINSQNKEAIETKYGKKYEELDIVNDKIEDKDLVITLAGIRFLGILRGISSVTYRPVIHNSEIAVTICSLKFQPNFETEGKEREFEAIANASHLNCNGFGKIYLSEMSENRSFCRALRSFLKISVVSREELPSSNTKFNDEPQTSAPQAFSPRIKLSEVMEKRSYSFEDIKLKLVKSGKYPGSENYNSINDIPNEYVLQIIERLNKKSA